MRERNRLSDFGAPGDSCDDELEEPKTKRPPVDIDGVADKYINSPLEREAVAFTDVTKVARAPAVRDRVVEPGKLSSVSASG